MKKSILLTSILLISVLFCTVLVGCSGYPKESAAISEYKENVELTQDYVYMWQRDGLHSSKRTVNVQTPKYAMQIDALRGKIVNLGKYVSRNGNKYTECNFDALNQVKTDFFLTENGKTKKGSNKKKDMRIIESGRNMQKTDYIHIGYGGGNFKDFVGRVEYAAQQTHFSILYDILSERTCNVNLSFSMEFKDMTYTNLANRVGVKILDGNGNGFAIIPHDEKTVDIKIDKEKVVFSSDIAVEKNANVGFGAIFIPIGNDSDENIAAYDAAKSAEVVAYDKSADNKPVPVTYDAKRGVHEIDVSAVSVGSMADTDNHNNYETIEFNVINNTNKATDVTVCFAKNVGSDFSVTGISPMLRDNNTFEPTGEQVQVSKNWHSHTPSVAENSIIRHSEGMWYKGYATISSKPTSTLEREYLCAYAKWGDGYAASHAQLCLIGWGGNQLWDQSAIGTWGESATYDPDRVLERSYINDVRPFMVTAPTGGNKQFDWSGNVGGGDFLVYKSGLDNKYLIGNRVEYITSAPNLTQVKYSGITEDGKIAAEIIVKLGRTDDIVRNVYSIKYTFLDDTNYSRLALFKIGADKYADNYYSKYAYGDASGAIASDLPAAIKKGYQNAKSIDAKNDNFWFAQYASGSDDERADNLMTVRDFNANINGKHYVRPGYKIHGTNDYQSPQASCEVTLPSECGKKIKKNSVIEMTVEYSVLPSNADTYYGDCDYITADKANMGTAAALFNQVKNNTINANVTVGTNKTIGSIVNIDVNNSSDILAEFSLIGGLGYTPIVFDGLNSYSGYRLQVKTNGVWGEIGQAVHGNDYWQTYRNISNNTYQMVFNVKNSTATDFAVSNYYRLIKI